MVTKCNLVFRVAFLPNANVRDIKTNNGECCFRGIWHDGGFCPTNVGPMGDLFPGDYI